MKSCLKTTPSSTTETAAPSSCSRRRSRTRTTTAASKVDFEPLVSVKIIVSSEEDTEEDEDRNHVEGEVDAFVFVGSSTSPTRSDVDLLLWYTPIEYRRIKRRNQRTVRKMQQRLSHQKRRIRGRGRGRGLIGQVAVSTEEEEGPDYYDDEENDDTFRGLERHVDMARKTRIYRSIRSVLQEQDRLFMKTLHGHGHGSSATSSQASTTTIIADIYSGFCLPSLKKAIAMGRQDRIDADAIYYCDGQKKDYYCGSDTTAHTATTVSDSSSSEFESDSDDSDDSETTVTPPLDSIRVAKVQSIRQSITKETGVATSDMATATPSIVSSASSSSASASAHEMFFLGETIMDVLIVKVEA